jgi:nucleotide-binding universal stress UspA family protein
VAVPGCRAQPGIGARDWVHDLLDWVTEESWMACVDAALARAPADDVALLHVTDTGAVDAAQGAFSALLGRAGAGPAAHLQAMAETAATEVLEAAAARLGRPAGQLRRQGRPEREVVQAAQGADLLILARQGGEAGPRSLGKAARFVVDNAACPVLLVWPGAAPLSPLPPPPPPGGRPRPPHRPPHGRGDGGGPPPQRLE